MNSADIKYGVFDDDQNLFVEHQMVKSQRDL